VIDIKHNLSRVFSLRKKIADQAFNGLVGSTADKSILESIAQSASRILSSNVSEDIVYRSIENLAGKILTIRLIYETSWRLSGNIRLLSIGVPIKPWNRQVDREWVPFQITEYDYKSSASRKMRDGNKVFFHTFKLQTLAGTPCPILVSKSWSTTGLSIVSKILGFSNSWGKNPYKSPRQFVGMRFRGLLLPEVSTEVMPGFRELKSTSTMLKWNKDLLKIRARAIGDFSCPEEFNPVLVPCHSCFRGYESCQAATHPYDYALIKCPICNSESWADDSDICINCYTKRKL